MESTISVRIVELTNMINIVKVAFRGIKNAFFMLNTIKKLQKYKDYTTKQIFLSAKYVYNFSFIGILENV